MITTGEYYKLMSGANQGDPAYKMNQQTKSYELDYSKLSDTPGQVVKNKSGDLISFDSFNWALKNQEEYKNKMGVVLQDMSPYFTGKAAKDNFFMEWVGDPAVKFGYGASQFAGQTLLSIKGLPSVYKRDAAKDKFKQSQSQLSYEETDSLMKYIESIGGKNSLKFSTFDENTFKRIQKTTNKTLNDKQKQTLLDYQKYVQEEMMDEQNMEIFNNFNISLNKSIDQYAPAAYKSTWSASPILGNLSANVGMNYVLSKFGFVGKVAALGVNGINAFYTKRIEALSAGKTEEEANQIALINGVGQSLIEMLSLDPMSSVIGPTVQRSVRNVITKFIVPEGTEEAAATLFEAGLDKVTGLKQQRATEVITDMVISFVLGGVAGGMMGGIDYFAYNQVGTRMEALKNDENALKELSTQLQLENKRAPLALGYTSKLTDNRPIILGPEPLLLEGPSQADLDYSTKVAKHKENVRNVVRDIIAKKYPDMPSNKIEGTLDLAFRIAQEKGVQDEITMRIFNLTDNLVKSSNWNNDMARENIEEYLEMFSGSETQIAKKQALDAALSKMLDKNQYEQFRSALVETSMQIRNDLEAAGMSEADADFFAQMYEGMFYKQALASGKTPMEIYNAIKPNIINLTRAKLNGQGFGFASISDSGRKLADEGIDASTALALNRDAYFKYKESRSGKGKNAKTLKGEADSIFFGKTEKTPSAANTINSLVNDGYAQQRIHQQMGVLNNLRTEDYIFVGMLRNQGYTESEIIQAFGAKPIENAEAAYNDALQKVYPKLSAEEIQTVNNIKKNLLKNKNISKGGVYDTQENAVLIGADASRGTLKHEVSHTLLYQSLMQSKQNLDNGIDFGTPADNLVKKLNRIAKKKYGAFPNERQIQETFADAVMDYLKNNKSSDPDLSVDMYDALEQSEMTAISDADSMYSDLSKEEKASIQSEIGKITNKGHRDYQGQLEKARELEFMPANTDNVALEQNLRAILTDKKNPIRGGAMLEAQLNMLPHDDNRTLGLFDIALSTAEALRRTAAYQFVNEFNKGFSSSLKTGQIDVYRGFFSGAESMAIDPELTLSGEFFSKKKIALSEKKLAAVVAQANFKSFGSLAARSIGRLIMSPYGVSASISPAIARQLREVAYQSQESKNVAKVQNFWALMKDGMAKNNVSNYEFNMKFTKNVFLETEAGLRAAKEFVYKYTGENGVNAFQECLDLLSYYKDEMKKAGVDLGVMEIYFPRRIKDIDAFYEHLDKTPQHPLRKIIREMRVQNASEEDIADMVNSVFYGQQAWEKNKVTSFNARKVGVVRDADLPYYVNPIEGMIMSIQDYERTIMMRKLFGYAQENLGESVNESQLEKDIKEAHLDNRAIEANAPFIKDLNEVATKEHLVKVIEKYKLGTYDSIAKEAKSDKLEDILSYLYKDKFDQIVETTKQDKDIIKKAEEDSAESIKKIKEEKAKEEVIYGRVGAKIAQDMSAGKLSKEQANDLFHALRSLANRTSKGNRVLDFVRNLNTLTIIGSKLSSAAAVLLDMKIVAAKYGPINAIRALSKALTTSDSFLDEINIPYTNEIYKPTSMDKISGLTMTSMQKTGFSYLEKLSKKTNALAALAGIKDGLNADKNSIKYKKAKSMLDRVFYVDPKFDTDGKYAAQRKQVEEDLKSGKLTDDVKFLAFNAIADQQPINVLEVPVGYNNWGSIGKLCYQFKTPVFKQLESIYIDTLKVYGNDKEKLDALAILLGYAFNAILFGVPLKALDSLIKGKKPDSLIKMSFFSVAEQAMLSEYFMYTAMRDGISSAAFKQLSPQFALLNDMSLDLKRVVFGDTAIKDARTFRNAPIIGEFYWNWLGGGRAYSERKNEFIFSDSTEDSDIFNLSSNFVGGFGL